MRILISCIPFDRGRSGISTYIRNVVGELAAQGHDLTLLVEPGDAGFFPGFRTIQAPGWTRRAVCSMLWHLLILPFRIRRKEYDFCLIAAANRRAFACYPLFTVAVVHDLAQYHVAGKYDRLRMFYLKYVLPFFIRRAPAVLAISRSTARDLETFWRVAPQKIRVVWNGLSLPEVSNPLHDWPERNGLAAEPYILYISRIESPGKNHLNLIRAFELLPERLASRCRLVCAGADWHGAEAVHAAAANSSRRGRILFTGFLPAGDLEAAFRNAACYVFPSFFEGFGLSLIEAMHYRVPCCCSNNSSLGEIGEGAALLFDPGKPEEIAAALTAILESEETRSRLIAAGEERARAFRWSTHAAKIAGWCREAAASRSAAVLFGIPVARVATAEALDRIAELAGRPPAGRCRILVTLNVDFLVNALPVCFHRAVPGLLPVLRGADFVCADGMPVVLLSRLLGCPLPERVAGADLVPLLAERAARDGLRLYFLGGAPDQTRKAEAILLERFPGLRIVGIDTPFVSPDDTEESRRQDAEICARINAARPDLLLVAFGNPKQELWLGRNAAQLKAAAAIGIGGSFNFLSGSVRRAPRWMQRSGLEWVYRIVQEPARLWKRYGLGLLKFGWLAGWSAAASWIGALLPNCREPVFAFREKENVVEAECSGVHRLGNPERRTILAARLEADRRRCPLRFRNAGPLLRFQLRAHRLL